MASVQEQIKSIIIEKRLKQESDIQRFKEGLDTIRDKKAVFGDLVIPEDFSLKAFCPEVYNEYPDPKVYKEQFDAMNTMFMTLNKCITEYNERAVQRLNQLKGA